MLHVSLSGELPPAELQNCSMQGPERDGVFAQTGVNSSGRSEVLIIEPVHTAARTELEGGVDVPPKSGPQFEDTEFRAGLAALRKLKLESEQGLQKGSSEPADGSLRWELRQSVSGSLAGSFDTGNDTPSKAAVKDSKVSVEDGANQEKAVKESGKGKWSFGFGRSGKKSVSLEMPQESDVGLGQETADGTDKETSRDFGGEGARGKIEKESAKGEGNGKKRQGGDGSGGKGGKKKRKDKKGAVENGAEAAPTETQNAAKTSGEEDSRLKTDGDDVSGSVDVSGAPEKRPKKGLLRKALRLKRSKKGKPQAEEVAEAAQEGMTRGEPAKIEEGTQAGSCHVAGETRAKDTPVKITLEGVRIVVRPKNADADVGTPEQDEGGGQVDVSSPAVLMSAAGEKFEQSSQRFFPGGLVSDAFLQGASVAFCVIRKVLRLLDCESGRTGYIYEPSRAPTTAPFLTERKLGTWKAIVTIL